MPVFESHLKHRVVDYEGAIKVSTMRFYFENLVNCTSKLSGTICLDSVQVENGEEMYSDPVTETLFQGFAIGLRAGQRIQEAGGLIS